jgi:signal transduction histidine kinase
MISDLLEFASTQLGERLFVTCAPMSMRDACQLAIDEIAVLHPQRTFNLDAQGVLLGNWDGARIDQMLSNLIGNATEHGFPNRPIRVSCYESDGEVLIDVQKVNGIAFSNRWHVAQMLQEERCTVADAIWASAFTLRARSPRHMGER